MSVLVEVDLRSLFGAARDQGNRPTCLAFAVSDAHAAIRGPWAELSSEYAFYHAQRRTGRSPTKGAFLSDMLGALREEGQPLELGWPYLTQLPADLSKYVPPASVGSLYGRDGRQPPRDFDRVCRLLDNGVPAVLLCVLTRSFFQPSAGGVVDHIDGDEVFPTPRHAVVAVGYGRMANRRVVLVRNSWGPTWGLSGYGWLTEEYLTHRMYDLAILTDETDVSHRSAAA
ncbi:MAG: C1 family peptidase [Pseudomonadota bacterium]